jgi:uncharacterized protein (DUF885 family)
MRRLSVYLLTVWMLSALNGCTGDDQPMDATDDLNQLFTDFWDFQMETSPTWATYVGDHRFDDRLSDVSPEAIQRETETLREFQSRLLAIVDSGKMRPGDSLNVELFERDLARKLRDLSYQGHLMPISQQGGPQIGFPELINSHPFETVEDCRNFVSRLRAFPKYIDQTIANMRQGIAQGLVPAKITMEKALPQIAGHIVDDPTASVLAGAVEKLGEGIPETERDRLADSILSAIQTEVIPTYRRLASFVRDEYLPACRDTVGILALPDGTSRYRYLAEKYTTTPLTPDSIFEIGKRELASIHEAMRAIMNEVGFEGTLREFVDTLRRDPRFYYTTPDSLVDGFKAILAKMDEKMRLLFGRLPEIEYSYREMEPYRAASAPDAYYYSAPDDGSRPAYFYINTYRPEMRPKYTMEALAYHEAVPGHHLQIALQQELAELPEFRRHGGYTAFSEGWALYSEQLPKEVGLYADSYSEFGRLTFDAWRATRLVVDPGIHYFGWTREEAIEFFRENTALSELNVISEVERYIAWPGQALAYKIGQLRIRKLREEAEKTLGDRFDLRAFHDELLADGALPLDLLEIKMNRWLTQTAQGAER